MRATGVLGLVLLFLSSVPAGAAEPSLDTASTARLLRESEKAHRAYGGALTEVEALLREWDAAKLRPVKKESVALAEDAVKRMNALLARMPREWTGGFRIDVARAVTPPTQTVHVPRRLLREVQISDSQIRRNHPDDYCVSSCGFFSTWRRRIWAEAHDEQTENPSYSEEVQQALREIRDKIRPDAHPRVRAALRRVQAVEGAIGARLDTRSAGQEVARFLRSARSLDDVADLAERTKAELLHLVGGGTLRREQTFRADARTTYDRQQESSSSSSRTGPSIGIGIGSLGLSFSGSGQAHTTKTSDREHLEHVAHAEADTLVPWAEEVDLVIRSPLGPEPKDADGLRALAQHVAGRGPLSLVETRVVMEKALTLKRLVDHLAAHEGGRSLTPSLRRWMQTRINVWAYLGQAQGGQAPASKLGGVVLSSAESDVAALDRALAPHGARILGPEDTRRIALQPRATLRQAIDRPLGGPSPRAPGRVQASRSGPRR